MANCVIAYDPCFSCAEKKCEICELDMHRKGVFQQSEGEWKTEIENWVYNIKKKYCSNCGKAPHYDKHMGEYLLTNFCPNCGAKMKGDSDIELWTFTVWDDNGLTKSFTKTVKKGGVE